MLLVHRLEDPSPDRISRRVPCSPSVMTGITSASQASCLQSFEELLRTGTAHAEFSGRVGDCCDDEVVSQVNLLGQALGMIVLVLPCQLEWSPSCLPTITEILIYYQGKCCC